MRLTSSSTRSLAALAALLMVESGCGWGSEALQRKIAGLSPDRIAGATVELRSCDTSSAPIANGTLAELLKRIADLKPAPTIGTREEWSAWRIVRIRTTSDEYFKISVGTRASLKGKPIVTLQEDPSGGMGFYAGEAFWSWLSKTPESTSLDSTPVDLSPCS